MTIALVASLLLAAAPAGDVVKIGHVTSLTAGSIDVGMAMSNAAKLAAEEVNAAGGVLGKKLVVVDGDDVSNTEKGVEAVTRLLDEERVAALIGPLNTGVGKAVVRLTNARKVPHVVTVNTACEVNELFKEFPQNFVFRLAASDALQVQMVVTEAFAARGRKKLALLHDETAYGTENRARFEALLAQRGTAPAYVGMFKIGQTEMGPLVEAARTAGADVVVLWGRGGEGAAVVRAMEKLAWKVDVLGSWQMANPAFLRAAGPWGDGTVMPQTFVEAAAADPVQRHFVEGYRRRFQKANVDAASAAAQTYDAVHLLALAMKQAGTTEGPRVQAALEDLKASYEGVTGAYDRPWMPTDHEGITPAQVTWAKAKGGAVVADDRAAN
jgi:branched-chain amino acid transport system substrate-binding protein